MALEMLGEAEVDVGEVDEDGDGRMLAADGAYEAAVLRVDERRMANHFRDAHMRDIFGADDAVLARALHLATAEAEEGRGGMPEFEVGDQLRAVVISAGLTG